MPSSPRLPLDCVHLHKLMPSRKFLRGLSYRDALLPKPRIQHWAVGQTLLLSSQENGGRRAGESLLTHHFLRTPPRDPKEPLGNTVGRGEEHTPPMLRPWGPCLGRGQGRDLYVGYLTWNKT